MIAESFDPDRTVMVLPLIDSKDGKNRRQKPAANTGRITQEKENQVIDLLVSEGAAGRSRIVQALELGPTRTKDILSSMVSKGLIVPEGTGRARVYRLPDEARE